MITDEAYVRKLVEITTGRKVTAIIPYTVSAAQSNDDVFGKNTAGTLYFGDFSGNASVQPDTNTVLQFNVYSAPTNSNPSAIKNILTNGYGTPAATTGTATIRCFQWNQQNILFQWFDYYTLTIVQPWVQFTFTGYKITIA